MNRETKLSYLSTRDHCSIKLSVSVRTQNLLISPKSSFIETKLPIFYLSMMSQCNKRPPVQKITAYYNITSSALTTDSHMQQEANKYKTDASTGLPKKQNDASEDYKTVWKNFAWSFLRSYQHRVQPLLRCTPSQFDFTERLNIKDHAVPTIMYLIAMLQHLSAGNNVFVKCH